MDINFVITYIILPIIMSIFIINGDRIEKRTFINVLITKGVFYYLLAIITLVDYFYFNKTLQELIIGFTVYIAIVEGSTAIKQAIDQQK